MQMQRRASHKSVWNEAGKLEIHFALHEPDGNVSEVVPAMTDELRRLYQPPFLAFWEEVDRIDRRGWNRWPAPKDQPSRDVVEVDVDLFDHDSAMDLLHDAAEAPDTAAFLAGVMAAAVGQTDDGDPYRGAAAASLVADARSGETPTDPLAEEWFEENSIIVDSDLVDLAHQAVAVARSLPGGTAADDHGVFLTAEDAAAYDHALDRVASRLGFPDASTAFQRRMDPTQGSVIVDGRLSIIGRLLDRPPGCGQPHCVDER